MAKNEFGLQRQECRLHNNKEKVDLSKGSVILPIMSKASIAKKFENHWSRGKLCSRQILTRHDDNILKIVKTT